MTSPLANALVYGLPGFVLGVIAGWCLRKEIVMEEKTGRARDEADQRWLLWLKRAGVAVMVLVVVASSVLVFIRQNEAVECEQRAFNDLVSRIDAGSQLGTARDEATADLLGTIISGGDVGAAIDSYLAQKRNRDAATAALPPYSTFQQLCP